VQWLSTTKPACKSLWIFSKAATKLLPATTTLLSAAATLFSAAATLLSTTTTLLSATTKKLWPKFTLSQCPGETKKLSQVPGSKSIHQFVCLQSESVSAASNSSAIATTNPAKKSFSTSAINNADTANDATTASATTATKRGKQLLPHRNAGRGAEEADAGGPGADCPSAAPAE